MKTTKSLFYSRTTRRQSVLNLIKSPARKRVPFALRLMGGTFTLSSFAGSSRHGCHAGLSFADALQSFPLHWQIRRVAGQGR